MLTFATGKQDWSERSIRELTRIPDKKQAARVAAKAVKAVEQSEKEASKNPDAKPMRLSSSTIKRFVDEDLGVTSKPKEKFIVPARERSDLHRRLPRRD